MKFCKECGKELKENASFCNECGTPLVQTNGNQPTTTTVQSVPKKPMSKKAKRAWIIGIVALIILFGVHKLVDSLMSKDRLIDKFETALIEKDAKQVANLLTSNDKKLEINEKSIAGLMKYFKENPDQVQETIATLEAQSRLVDNADKEGKSLVDLFADGLSEYGLVTLKQDGKFLFYDKFQLNIASVYLTLETNYKDTVLSVDGKEVGTADKPDYEATYGPFLPGYHTISGKLKTDFVDLEQKEDIFLNGYDNKEHATLYLDAEEVTVELPPMGMTEFAAKLFINGKDVGVNLYENPTFGPVLTDGSMTLSVEADAPWGTVKTEEIPIDDDYLDITYINDELKNTLMDTVHLYLQEWTTAYTSVDNSAITTAVQGVKDEVIEEANENKEQEYALEAQYLGVDFDLDSFSLYNPDGAWQATVSVLEHWNRDYFYKGDEVELEEDSDARVFYLIYDETQGKWLVSGSDYSWGFDEDNIKEYTIKEPKSLVSTWLGN
ncbi:zinc ribbon domain-containing protein [Ferdinandcohnia sp. Marseille-Q9671]